MEKVSKNYYKGFPILNTEMIDYLARARQSVYHPVWGVKPAAFILNLQLWIVIKAIDNKQLFTIIRDEENTKKKS